ncbi:hypothetical protein, partial [Klebsiella pneumoniae]|uniref:hypothetical protein n=1 Tax=Klebsiella pneumoniae TaxID=573 RepID=UPI002245E6AA
FLGGIVGTSGTGFAVRIYGIMVFFGWNRWNFWNIFKNPYISRLCALFLFQNYSKTVPERVEYLKSSSETA